LELLSPAHNLNVGRIGWNNFCSTIFVEQVSPLEVMQIRLAVITVTKQTAGSIFRKRFELSAELSAFTLYLHDGGLAL
jgi:hypothetical protein